jgi:peptidylprolyl isomerase
MRRRDLVFPTALAVAAASSCARPRQNTAQAAPAAKAVRTASGLVYEVIQAGSGAIAKPGNTVLIHETLTVDGKEIFSSRTKNAPVKFLIGGNQVIPGVDETVSGMRVGERRRAIVPPALDGRKFDPAFIRPDADRHYDIELVEILPIAP